MRIRYSATDNQLYLAFESSATHRVSRAVEHLTNDFLAQNHPQPTIVVDLGPCTFLDSTFAGWMIRLQQRLRSADGRMIISRCPERCRTDLEVMGLTSLLQFEDCMPPTRTSQITCPVVEDVDAETIELMLRAHEDLSHVNAGNERAFAPIADTLRRELEKKQ